jgi:hypothetical protein
MSRVIHSLVGYDRASECIAEEVDVPDAVLARAKELARVPADDPDAIMCYPLDASGARDLAHILKTSVDIEQRDYFLEGFADDRILYEFADDAAFRQDGGGWSVWIHDDAKADHVKVTIGRAALDDYASRRGYRDHRAVIKLLDSGLKRRVQTMINDVMGTGRAGSGRLELDGNDLAAALDD